MDGGRCVYRGKYRQHCVVGEEMLRNTAVTIVAVAQQLAWGEPASVSASASAFSNGL